MAVPLESSREKPMSMMEMDGEAAIACHHSSSQGGTAMAMGAGEAPGLAFDEDYDSDPHDEAEPLHPQAICDCHCNCRRTCSPSSISCRPPNHISSRLDTKIHSHPHLARPCPAHSNHFPFILYSTYSYFSSLLSDLASRVGYSSSASSTSKVSSSTCHLISLHCIIPPLGTMHLPVPHAGCCIEKWDGPQGPYCAIAGAFTGL